MGDFHQTETVGHILVVTIDRPAVMNALHRPANLELEAVWDAFEADDDLWIAILTGAGERAFCAGNDLKYQAEGNDTTIPVSGFGGITARRMTKPVIAAVNGLALGGGFEIALACDIILASETAAFGLPEPRVGLAAAAGGLIRLPHVLPRNVANEMALTARRMGAEEALRHGLVSRIVPRDELLKAATDLAHEILKGSPLALRAAKDLLRRSVEGTDFETLYAGQKNLPAVRALYDSADRLEGPRAFAEKRAPVWTGR
ncbi:enoyl-CoA hydratase-related protein [Acuticoccus kandeliae]|uniref:enoyl-CoA hydratase-related protein n=1 Tax=Acuticoccus kandeliae TaxID=2073160 RepID=UPI000D3E66DD|nr:enoyl-CoA hydratase-related protein [Acuticoccus kandeliae]